MADYTETVGELSGLFSDDSDNDRDYIPNFNDLDSSDSDLKDAQPRLSIDITNEIPETSSNNSVPEIASGHKNKETGEVMSSRKRMRHPEKHKKTIRKLKRAKGEEYLGATGKIVRKKQCSVKPCDCKLECINVIPIERREKIFEGFYNLNWSEKNSFLSGQIEVSEINRKYTKNAESRRKKTRIYRLSDASGEDKIVCKKFFQETLDVCDGTITNILKRKQALGTPQPNKRGKHVPHNKTSQVDEKIVCNFIERFPTYESHYCRRDSSRKYLPENLNITKLYELYVDDCNEKGFTPVSCYMFRHFFNTKFNLHFHSPHKDTCPSCDEFKVKVKCLKDGDEKRFAITNHEVHLRKVDAIHEMKKKDISKAKVSNGIQQVIVFALEKTLPTPSLNTNVVYYKRQLWTYNLGIHDHVTDIGHMYVWGEHTASRGAQEISSCLLYHIRNTLPQTTRELTLYSDSCGGQNRNIKVALMLSYILQETQLQEINQKFFIPGHSFNSCDVDFGIIERAKKSCHEIFHPDDWLSLIANAKKRKPKFEVHKMTSDEYLSTKSLENDITNRKISDCKAKVEWLKMRWIQIRKDKQKKIFFKYSCSEDTYFDSIDISKKEKRGRPTRDLPKTLDLLFPHGRPISNDKKKDLLSLLKFIPPIHHRFYKDLKIEVDAQKEDSSTDEEDTSCK